MERPFHGAVQVRCDCVGVADRTHPQMPLAPCRIHDALRLAKAMPHWVDRAATARVEPATARSPCYPSASPSGCGQPEVKEVPDSPQSTDERVEALLSPGSVGTRAKLVDVGGVARSDDGQKSVSGWSDLP